VQAQCPQCSTRIQIDDAKVPDRPFSVRCPKCQNMMRLPGRGGEAAAATVEPAGAGAAAAPSAPIGIASPPPPAAPPIAVRPRGSEADGTHDVLIALADPTVASHVGQAFRHLGFNVETVEDIEEGARLIEQGVYEVAVTARTPAGAGHPETLFQRILRLPPYTRRRVFVVFVGEEFKTADGTQAWAAQADLVVNPRDAGTCEGAVRAAMAERRRLYQPFEDARRRLEAE